jgi:hypothetical protein
MMRRTLLRLLLFGGAGAGAFIAWRSLGFPVPNVWIGLDDGDRRVRFICCDEYDDSRTYSPAVYLRVGGGREAFDTVRKAAPFLRPDDPGSAAAGLSGFLFNTLDYDGDTGGTMSLEPPPQPGNDGKIDWDACDAFGGDGDIILINVRSRSAKCCYGVMAGHEIRDLPLGMRKVEKR